GGTQITYGGNNKAEVPAIRGILNGAMSPSGVLIPSGAGKFTLPSKINDLAFSKAVVSAYAVDPNTKKVSSRIVYQGFVDYEGKQDLDWSRLSMREVGDIRDVNSTDQLVLQIFLARADLAPAGAGVLDSRSLNLPYVFTPVAADKKTPKDYLVPLMNESCSPASSFGFPSRANASLPNELVSSTLCPYSAPFEKRLLENGQVRVTALSMVPVYPGHTFPTDLLRRSNQPACVSKNPSDKDQCWVVNSNTAPKVLTDPVQPFLQDKSCENWQYITSSYSYSCGYRGQSTCYGTTGQWVFLGYKAACAVLDANQDECQTGLAIRFAGYEQMAMASLGCAVNFEKSGVAVSATKVGEGIIPYTPQFGGGKVGMQSAYSATSSPRGYGCIPCRFGDISDDNLKQTAPIPVDQTATGSQNRLPIFTYVKSEAPKDCVKEQEVEIRYFGSSACTGYNNPAGHACTAFNIGNTQCQATNSNVAGKFKVKVCPGGGFEFDKIAVSWSPLVLDVTGNGIHISRVPQLASTFDIKGSGKAARIDWPMNTHEVAFLVLPNEAGEVKSIRELFGDYKAKNGFESLKSRMDSNRDGVVNSRDQKFRSLRLWFDRNRNGIAEPQELETLEQHGVESIALNYSKPRSKGIEGQTLQSRYFNAVQNRFMNIEDIYFYEYRDDGKRIGTEAKTK
ncbi:MAG: hypothetical protein KGQ59_03810, partial [Bdellovibrionales bacterium]|nr:hypothetical protein [Bdellovibrionales bacterium]